MVKTLKCIPALTVFLAGLAACMPLDREPPVVKVHAFPAVADTLTVIKLDASQTTDNLTQPGYLLFRWDIGSDHTWESEPGIDPLWAWRFSEPGIYPVTCEVTDGSGNKSFGSIEIQIREVRKDSLFTDPRNEKRYRSTLLGNLWWMSENLQYGVRMDDSDLPGHNLITEFYQPADTSLGSFYPWNEVVYWGTDTVQGICPDGWRLPRIRDLDQLNSLMYFRSNLNKYLLEEGVLGTDFTLGGRYVRSGGIWEGQGFKSSYWVTDGSRPGRFRTWMLYRPQNEKAGVLVIYEGDFGSASIEGWPREWGEFDYGKVALPVRCVKERK